MFKLFQNNKVKQIEESDFLLCTGLFDEFDKDLNYYNELFKNSLSKKMICTNPDLVVDRGSEREFCAGSVAKIFEKMGGKVNYFGKPYPLVYSLSADTKNKKILCIGDNLNTDIKGANNQNYASLFVSGGIHRKEAEDNLETLAKTYDVKIDYVQSNLAW